MLSAQQLREARQQLVDAYNRDIAAVDHLIARFSQIENNGPTQLPLRIEKQQGVSPATAMSKSPVMEPEKVRHGSMRYWIMHAFRKAPGAKLTSPQMYDIAIRDGAGFADDRDRAIGSFGVQLKRMVEERVVERIHHGSGRNPSEYRWIGKELQEPTHAGS